VTARTIKKENRVKKPYCVTIVAYATYQAIVEAATPSIAKDLADCAFSEGNVPQISEEIIFVAAEDASVVEVRP